MTDKDNLEDVLNEGFEKIRKKQEKLYEEAEKLVPYVLKHFNEYVETKINPKLPEGYSIVESTSAHFYATDGTFKIRTGAVDTPHGWATEPLECEKEIMMLCYDYEAKTPWISKIDFGFYLNE
jgi:hypothetical protein